MSFSIRMTDPDGKPVDIHTDMIFSRQENEVATWVPRALGKAFIEEVRTNSDSWAHDYQIHDQNGKALLTYRTGWFGIHGVDIGLGGHVRMPGTIIRAGLVGAADKFNFVTQPVIQSNEVIGQAIRDQVSDLHDEAAYNAHVAVATEQHFKVLRKQIYKTTSHLNPSGLRLANQN